MFTSGVWLLSLLWPFKSFASYLYDYRVYNYKTAIS